VAAPVAEAGEDSVALFAAGPPSGEVAVLQIRAVF